MASSPLLHRPMALEEFEPFVGREFEVDCQPKLARIMLVEASAARSIALAERPAFDLIFRSGPDVLLLAGTYAMQCGAFGPDLIHITPIVSQPGSAPGYTYQAAFN